MRISLCHPSLYAAVLRFVKGLLSSRKFTGAVAAFGEFVFRGASVTNCEASWMTRW